MPAFGYAFFPLSLGLGRSIITTGTTTLKMMLLSAYTPGSGSGGWTAVYLADVLTAANETSGTNYTAGGQTLTSVVWSKPAGGSSAQLSSANAAWSAATFTARYGVVYDNATGVQATSPVICYVDFGAVQSPAAAAFTVTCPAGGWWQATTGNVILVTAPAAKTSTAGTAIVGFTVVASDSDPAQTLTFSMSGQPAGVVCSAAGVVSGTPSGGAGSFTAAVVASDPTGASGTASFGWTVNPAAAPSNTVTVTVPAGTRTGAAGTAITPFTVTAVDSDVTITTFAWALAGQPAGFNINDAGLVSGTPTTPGTSSVTVLATEVVGSGTPVTGVSAAFTWTVTGGAGVVTITSPGNRTTVKGSAVNLTVVGTDSNGLPLTWSAAGLPAGLTMSAAGVITGTPTTVSVKTVTLTASDSGGASDTASFSWTVTAVAASRFAGDPGVGKYYLGANDPASGSGMPINTFNSTVMVPLGLKASVARSYGLTFAFNKTKIDSALAAGLIPLTSYGMKCANFPASKWTPQDVAAGLANADIDADIAYLRTKTKPIWISLHHEPEDDFTTAVDCTAYRQAWRLWSARMKAANMSHVTIVGVIYMGGTYQDASRDWRSWEPEWLGTPVGSTANPGWTGGAWSATKYHDTWATDWYNPQVRTVTRRTYDDTISAVWQAIIAQGPASDTRPMVIGEMGMKTFHSIPDANVAGTVIHTMDDTWADLDAFAAGGHAPYAGKQIIAILLWNVGTATDVLVPLDATMTGASAANITTINQRNPAGWPNSGYYNVHDPDGIQITFTSTGGTYTLNYGGQTTTALAVAASGATVRSALGALTSIGGAGNVFVVDTTGLPLTVGFTGALKGTSVAITINKGGLTGGTATLTHTNKRSALANHVVGSTSYVSF